MAAPATFRDLHPVARDLAARLFEALRRSAEELLAKDTAAMTLVEHGRWTAQVLRLLKWIDKEFPEADEATKEGRAARHRLHGPEEDAATKAAFDAIFGIYQDRESEPEGELEEPAVATDETPGPSVSTDGPASADAPPVEQAPMPTPRSQAPDSLETAYGRGVGMPPRPPAAGQDRPPSHGSASPEHPCGEQRPLANGAASQLGRTPYADARGSPKANGFQDVDHDAEIAEILRRVRLPPR